MARFELSISIVEVAVVNSVFSVLSTPLIIVGVYEFILTAAYNSATYALSLGLALNAVTVALTAIAPVSTSKSLSGYTTLAVTPSVVSILTNFSLDTPFDIPVD